METPDITKAQIVAIIQPFLTLGISFGLPITNAQQAAILGAGGALSGVLMLADALIRFGRSRVLVAQRSGVIPGESVEGDG